MRTLRGRQKLASRCQPFLGQSSKLGGACWGVPVDWHVSFRLLISYSVAEIDYVRSTLKVGPIKRFLPQPVRGECPGVLGPNFSNSSYQWICVQVWLRSGRLVTSEIRRRKKKKEERKKQITAIKYKPFDIAIPRGLINLLTLQNVRQ